MVRLRRDFDDGQVGVGVVADNSRGVLRRVGKGHADAIGAVDDVGIGEDEAVRREDETAAGAGAFSGFGDFDKDDGGADVRDGGGDGL